MKLKIFWITTLCIFLAVPAIAGGDPIGEVSTVFKLIGPDHKIKIEAFDDPKVEGVTCHISRAVKGGVTGFIGIAEDKSDASVACRQIGPIKFKDKINMTPHGEEVFKQSTSILFKTMQVVRFYDAKRNVLVYLIYSDKLIDGSPKNSISTVPLGEIRPPK